MAKPFPDMPYWGAFPAMSPIPPGKASRPGDVQEPPAGDRPVHVHAVHAGQSLTLVRNPYWDPKTDPGRHAYPNEYDFNFATDSAKIDQTMLADSGSGQTTLSYDDGARGRLPEVQPQTATTG